MRINQNNNIALTLALVFVGFFYCCSEQKNDPELAGKDIHHVIVKMTGIMEHDITNPPLAARFFSYATLAGYEIVAQHEKKFKRMHGILNGYPDIKKVDTISHYDYRLASLLAVIETAKKMQPSGKMLTAYETTFLDSCKKIGFEEDVVNNSMRYALTISKQILAYAKADGYFKISNQPRYTPMGKDSTWYPTPPAFMPAVEPYFSTVRPFTLNAPKQFEPVPPTPFDPQKGSPYYRLTEAVYTTGKMLTDEQRNIAYFWDCNPFAVQDEGHLQYGFKKMSPGAHWLGVAGTACEKAKKNFDESMEVYMVVSIGLMDGFMCCWDEKYNTNRVRPETAIRRYIDPTWVPLLQTPPFPEYLSGHSVISATSATILTHYFGNDFAYTDSTEVPYGLPPRSFRSFQQASDEAGISRFYGGIHYMDAIVNGRTQGVKVGEWVLQKMKN